MRTEKSHVATKHLTNSRQVFLRLLEISREMDPNRVERFVSERDYEELDLYVMQSLLG